MGARLVLPQPAYRLEGVKIDYDLTPQQAVELLYGSNPRVALWSKDEMGLWHGGKTGVVKGATLPILWPRRLFLADEGRSMMEHSGIGFAWPVEVASLALPENNPEQIRRDLYALGMWGLVALRQSNEELRQHDGDICSFYLNLRRDFFMFYLDQIDGGWNNLAALVGAPQVSQ